MSIFDANVLITELRAQLRESLQQAETPSAVRGSAGGGV